MRQPLQLGWHAAYFMLFIMWFSIDMIKLGYTWNAGQHFNTSHLTKAYIKMRYTFVLYRWHCAVSSTLMFSYQFSTSRQLTGKRSHLAKCTSVFFNCSEEFSSRCLPNIYSLLQSQLSFMSSWAINSNGCGITRDAENCFSQMCSWIMRYPWCFQGDVLHGSLAASAVGFGLVMRHGNSVQKTRKKRSSCPLFPNVVILQFV